MEQELGPNHSASFDHRRRPETLRTAMAMAFFCPTNTTFRFGRQCNHGAQPSEPLIF